MDRRSAAIAVEAERLQLTSSIREPSNCLRYTRMHYHQDENFASIFLRNSITSILIAYRNLPLILRRTISLVVPKVQLTVLQPMNPTRTGVHKVFHTTKKTVFFFINLFLIISRRVGSAFYFLQTYQIFLHGKHCDKIHNSPSF